MIIIQNLDFVEAIHYLECCLTQMKYGRDDENKQWKEHQN